MWSTEYYSRNELCLIRMGFFYFFAVVFLLLLVVFIFPGIPTGDPAIVAFYDKRIYIIFLKWPLISRKETASEYDKINNCGPYPEITNISFLAKLFFKTFISLKHLSDYRTVGLSDYWIVGLSDCRIIATAPSPPLFNMFIN